jgi:hypothetical protein
MPRPYFPTVIGVRLDKPTREWLEGQAEAERTTPSAIVRR